MNDKERFARAREIFDAACDLPTDRQRALVDEQCKDDPDLRTRVERMLAMDASAAPPLDATPGAGIDLLAATAVKPPDLPNAIGHYRIIREIGRGGMGVVYEALQENPSRTVALKVLREIIAGRQAAHRFEQEANLLGRLHHPGIAQVYEAGVARATLDSGRDYEVSFFAMELVRGVTIDEHVQTNDLGRRQRLELVALVADAVQHAHDNGVIHRDLKPDNILIDERGQPKVLDFGIARITDADVQTVTMKTEVGQIVGTLAYMSPEQLAGNPDAIDERSDVYALGVLLFRLLADRMPFDLRNKPIVEVARIVQHDEPSTLHTSDRSLRGDAQTIVATAMEKDPARRYQSPAALASDIRRFLADEPIVARPATTLYQFGKFARRNKALVGGVAASFLILALGLISTGVLLARVTSERNQARAATDEAQDARRRIADVAEFQRKLLAGFSASDIGRDIEHAIADEYRESLGPEDPPPETLDRILDNVNDINLGRDVLRETIAARAASLLDSGDATDDPLAQADIRCGVGAIMSDLGDYARAAEQYAAAADIRRNALGPNHHDTLEAIADHSQWLVTAQRPLEAEPIVRDLIDRCRQHLGPSHTLTRDALSRLGMICRSTGRLDEAIELLEKSLLDARDAQDHVRVVLILNELGVLMLDNADTERALEYFDKAIDLAKEHADRRRLYISLNNTMAALFKSAQHEAAERYARKSIPAFAAVYGDKHPRTIMVRSNLARVLLDLDQTPEALVILEALEPTAMLLPPESNVRQAVATNLIEARLRSGHPDKALALARELLESRESNPDTYPGAIAQTLEQIGECLLAQGRADEAREAFTRCADTRAQIDPDHWLTHRARLHTGAALAAQGRFEEAEPLLTQSAAAITAKQADITANMRDRELAAAARAVATMYTRWNKPDLANAWADGPPPDDDHPAP